MTTFDANVKELATVASVDLLYSYSISFEDLSGDNFQQDGSSNRVDGSHESLSSFHQ